jgi:hypothetical protein
MQSRQATDCWVKSAANPAAAAAAASNGVSASSLYLNSRADSQNIYGRTAQLLFDVYKRMVKLPELGHVDQDGYEYGTCVNACILENSQA